MLIVHVALSEDSRGRKTMRYLHTMVRVRDVDESLDFYCNKLGLVEMLSSIGLAADRGPRPALPAPPLCQQ